MEGNLVAEKSQKEKCSHPSLSCNTYNERNILQQYKEADEWFFAAEEYAAFWVTVYNNRQNNSMIDLLSMEQRQKKNQSHDACDMKLL